MTHPHTYYSLVFDKNTTTWQITRTPSCTDAALQVSTAAGLKILPLYAMLYTFSQLAVQRKYDLPASWETIKSILRSSFFIFFHAYNGSVLGCALRRGFGRFYYRILVCAPALMSSYLSLIIEKPARRQALAFYLLNLASEIVYRMMVTKGYFKPMKHGETLLFALSLAAWYHLIKTHGFGHDPVSAAVKVLIGRDEAKSRSHKLIGEFGKYQPTEQQQKECRNNNNNKQISLSDGANADDRSLFDWFKVPSFLSFGGKHSCCPHNESSCLQYVLQPVPTRFLLGYGIQSLLKLSGKPYQLYYSPVATLNECFTSSQSIRFGLFLVTLVSAGRATSCLLRHFSQSNNRPWHASVAGFVAGLSMLWAPRSSLSMYIMWKAVEQYYLQAAAKKAYFNFTILTIYSMSAATILYTFALEPRFVRPSYMKFLDNLSDHRLHQLNRMVLDVFGTGSSVGYEDFFPDLDPRLMSNQFKELVFNWMIQPYE